MIIENAILEKILPTKTLQTNPPALLKITRLRRNPGQIVRERRKYKPSLEYKNFGLQESDLDTVFQAGNEIGIGAAKLAEIIDHLNVVYCQSIGIEFMYIRNPQELSWIKNRLQENSNTPNFSNKQNK